MKGWFICVDVAAENAKDAVEENTEDVAVADYLQHSDGIVPSVTYVSAISIPDYRGYCRQLHNILANHSNNPLFQHRNSYLSS